MSSVKKPNRYMNTARYDSSITGPSKMIRIHNAGEDYHKAVSLSQWLFVKYDIGYKTYRNKSKSQRDKLRREFELDTGINLRGKEHI